MKLQVACADFSFPLLSSKIILLKDAILKEAASVA